MYVSMYVWIYVRLAYTGRPPGALPVPLFTGFGLGPVAAPAGAGAPIAPPPFLLLPPASLLLLAPSSAFLPSSPVLLSLFWFFCPALP